MLISFQICLLASIACSIARTDLCPSSTCSCDGNRIDCSNKSLNSIPEFKQVPVTYVGWKIDLSYNNISSLASRAFINLNVSELEMTHNSLNYIADDAFDGSENVLTMLHLQYNNFTSLPVAIGKLFKLTTLTIQYNPVRFFSTEIMRNLSTSLQYFSFGSLDMTTWPSAINYLKELNFLTMYSLPMSDLPHDVFDGLAHANIYLLDFESTRLASIPKALKVLKNTTGRVLTNNLNISSADIQKNSLKGMISLQELSVDNCTWTEVPDFSELPNLLNLEFSDCPISRWVTDKSHKYSSLTRLTLDRTDITEIPSFLTEMKNMTYLSFFGTKITEITKDNLAGLSKIISLTMSYSPVYYISLYAFQDNKAMMYLSLDNLKLTRFPRAIKSVPSMKYVNLINNTIDCSCATMGFMKGWSGIGVTDVAGDCHNIKMRINDFLLNEVNKC